jgi:hypothetical protein
LWGDYVIFNMTGTAAPYYFAKYKAVDDANTVLLLHGNEFTDCGINHFTVVNTGVALYDKFGKFGASCFYFNQAARLQLTTPKTFGFGQGDFTFELWANPLEQTGDNFFLNGIGTGDLFVGRPNGTGGVGVGRSSMAWDAKASRNLTLNTWSHLAVVRESGTLSIYYNGECVFTAPNAVNYGFPNGKVCIGAQGSTLYFKGYMQEIRLSSVARYAGTSFDIPTVPFDHRGPGRMLGYITADSADAYPHNGVASDGYYYQLMRPVDVQLG